MYDIILIFVVDADADADVNGGGDATAPPFHFKPQSTLLDVSPPIPPHNGLGFGFAMGIPGCGREGEGEREWGLLITALDGAAVLFRFLWFSLLQIDVTVLQIEEERGGTGTGFQ